MRFVARDFEQIEFFLEYIFQLIFSSFSLINVFTLQWARYFSYRLFPRKTIQDRHVVSGENRFQVDPRLRKVERISGFRTACVAQTADKISAPQGIKNINISTWDRTSAAHKNARNRRGIKDSCAAITGDKTRNYRDRPRYAVERTPTTFRYFNRARVALSLLSPSAGTARFAVQNNATICILPRNALEMKESHGRIFCVTLGPPLWPFPLPLAIRRL